MFKGALVFISIILGAIVVLGFLFGTVVAPGEMGVRQIAFGPYQGYSRVALPPGYHWSIPFYSKILKVPQTIQRINLDRVVAERRNQRYQPDGYSYGAIEVQTTDGSSVVVDLSALVRFFAGPAADGSHGGPADLIQKLDVSPQRWMDRIQTATVNEVRKSLGMLSTSDFYNPHLRERAIEEAQKALNLRLAEFGIKIESLLLRRYTYSEERIDTAIFQKNLQDQEERLNTALSLLAEARADLEKVSAQWDARIKTLRVEGENQVRVLRSEADLYETERRAAADLLLAKAHAEVDRLKASALAKSQGADIYVARELAPLLASLQGGIVGDIDPYDLSKWMSKFGVAASDGRSEPGK